MKRRGFASKLPERPPRPDRSAEFASFKPQPRAIIEHGWLKQVGAQPPKPILKTPKDKGRAIRDSARGEECQVRLPGCPGNREQTIWSHNRHGRAGKGRGIKAIDLNGCYACGAWCDAIYDGQRPPPPGVTREAVELAWYHGHAESLVKLVQKGLA